MNWEKIIPIMYYGAATVALVVVTVKFLYGWFKSYDSALDLLRELSTVHLPYIYKRLDAISDKLGLEHETQPLIIMGNKNPKHQA